jgi:hypothetical protein
MQTVQFDNLVIDGTEYIYRNRCWTTPTGYCVSTAHDQMLTNMFYQRNGRVPGPPKAAVAMPPEKLRKGPPRVRRVRAV